MARRWGCIRGRGLWGLGGQATFTGEGHLGSCAVETALSCSFRTGGFGAGGDPEGPLGWPGQWVVRGGHSGWPRRPVLSARLGPRQSIRVRSREWRLNDEERKRRKKESHGPASRENAVPPLLRSSPVGAGGGTRSPKGAWTTQTTVRHVPRE